MRHLPFVLLFLASNALPSSAQAQSWPTTEWTLIEGRRAIAEDDLRETSLYAVREELRAASEWFKANGLNAPNLKRFASAGTAVDGRYPAYMTPRRVLVGRGADRTEVYGDYSVLQTGGVLRLNREAFLDSSFYANGEVQGSGRVRTSNYDTFTTPVHELFHAIQSSYASNYALSMDWIVEGSANGVALAWSRHRSYPGAASKGNYDTRPLYQGDYDRDHFWYFLIRDGGGVGVMHTLYDTRAASAQSAAPGIAWLDRGLYAARLGGLYRYLPYFTAKHLQGAEQFDAEVGVQVAAEGITMKPVRAQKPLTVKAFRARFPRPSELGRLDVKIEDAPPSVQIVIGEETFDGAQVSVETTDEMCGSGTTCEVPVRVVNVAVDPAATPTINYAVTFELTTGCDFRYPEGVSGVGYKISMPGQRPKYFAINFPGAADGSRQQLSGPFEARYLDTATGSTPQSGVGARMEGRMICNGGSLDIGGLTRAFSGSPVEQRRQTSAEASGSWALPARPSVGQSLPDVVSEIDIAIEGDRAFTATTRTFNQEIAGRERVPLEAAAERQEPRLRRGLSTWKVTGKTSGRGGLHEDALMGQMERTMDEMGVELDDATRGMIEGMMGGLLGAAEAQSASEPPQDFTLWYSLDYGVVKMVTAGATVELYRTYSQ